MDYTMLDPFGDGEKKIKPMGRCEYCNEEVFDLGHILFEDDAPYQIDFDYFLHRRCLMDYADANWKVCAVDVD